jgi:hypothetical protein
MPAINIDLKFNFILYFRSSNPDDPESVRVARFLEINQIIKWVQNAKNLKK